MTILQQQGAAAKAASYTLATAGTARKNAALEAIAKILTERQDEWLSANAGDVAAARAAGMTCRSRASISVVSSSSSEERRTLWPAPRLTSQLSVRPAR